MRNKEVNKKRVKSAGVTGEARVEFIFALQYPKGVTHLCRISRYEALQCVFLTNKSHHLKVSKISPNTFMSS